MADPNDDRVWNDVVADHRADFAPLPIIARLEGEDARRFLFPVAPDPTPALQTFPETLRMAAEAWRRFGEACGRAGHELTMRVLMVDWIEAGERMLRRMHRRAQRRARRARRGRWC